MQRVLILQHVLKTYRLALFEQMHRQLAEQGIELHIAFASPDAVEKTKGDNCEQPPASYYSLIKTWQWRRLTWHVMSQPGSYDLIIVEQANRHLFNHYLMLRRVFAGRPKLALWGHGYDHQGHKKSWRQRIKRYLMGGADWFFAYTAPVAEYARSHGMAAEAITTLNNSIDTRVLAGQVYEYRRTSAKTEGLPVLLYCGALYQHKRLDLLLQSAQKLYQRGSISKLIILGAGPLQDTLPAADWLDYRGPCFGEDKARAYAEASLVLNPGLTGLAILDAFAAGLPYITCDLPVHSPEIAYLEDGVNGLLLPPLIDHIVCSVAAVLADSAEMQRLSQGALTASRQYSLQAMSTAFCNGIRQCLSTQEAG
ncbi:glycosyltransferase family 4 protein [Lacimicrobium alkaliphilum]|uniref:Glycosyltransferase subfamily 4-like N-terminal domain-containing protein n=1 Tax=Lacimicrobium alkaliphilum TaxID=1526571 RepID=A0ABQ1RR59_9ALTE|nr:glycosyltransferase family 4 protein [Lacimicrobium alkaliphilum]GGD76683.1 hypothetical protein GCM10011357_34650 [Lacimicrobium alkaliphilum]